VTTTAHIGGYYELTDGVGRSYYYHEGQRVAMREGGTTTWLLGDHLGSTSVRADAGGTKLGELRYSAWGATRYEDGAILTSYRFTGQPWEQRLGLYQMGARWYDPQLGRWLSPDSIVPNPANPQSLNRYTYVYNNPLRRVDPSGNEPEDLAWWASGVASQWLHNNLWFLPSAQRALAAKPNEPAAKTEGRSAGNQLARITGTAQIICGSAATGGGLLLTPTGVGTKAGVVLGAGGIAVAAHGAVTAGVATWEELKELSNRLMMARGRSTPSASLQRAMEKKGLPTRGDIKFDPAGRELRWDKAQQGYVDKHGNVWQKGKYHGDPNLDFPFEWDVQLSEKGRNLWGEHLKPGRTYINVRPDGTISH
jgi:RHS repeat-associated protein